MTKISAPPRLRVIPILRHSRAGGNPSPALSTLSNILVRAEAQRRRATPLCLCASARKKPFLITNPWVIDIGLHGNDEFGWGGVQ
jgi:hypothetical protein